MYFRIFRDEGEAGGGPGTAGAEADSKSVATDAPTDDDTKKGADDNKGGEDDKGKKPEEPTIDSLTEQLGHLKSKLGKQGNELADRRKESDTLKSLVRDLKENPNLALSKMAKKWGADVTFNTKGEDPLEKALLSDDEEARLKILQQRRDAKKTEGITDDVMSSVRPMIDMIFDESLARKYPDYGELKEDRSHLELMSETGQITKPELLHLAAQGRNIQAAIKEAQVEAVLEYQKSLDKKAREQIDTSGDRLAEKQDIDFGDVAFSLDDIM